MALEMDRPEQRAATKAAALREEPELAEHPGPKEYIRVAVALAIATALEVGLYYTSIPHTLFVALLLAFAFFKFSLVALWFMHLRFDAPVFRRLFLLGISLALTVYLIVLFIFGVFHF